MSRDLDPQAIQDELEITTDGVVHVAAYDSSTTGRSGTGFIFHVEDGYAYVLTARHVTEDEALEYRVWRNEDSFHNAELVYESRQYDLASLKFQCDDCVPLAFSTQTLRTTVNQFAVDEGIAGGQEVVTLAYNALEKGIEVIRGRTIEICCWFEPGDSVRHDTYLVSGDSGSPLLNASGYVIGMNLSADAISEALYLVDEEWNKPIQNVLRRAREDRR